MSWYAVITTSGAEEQLQVYLQELLQLAVIFPKVERHFRIQKQDVLACKPLSAGCVLVECEDLTPYENAISKACEIFRIQKVPEQTMKVIFNLMDEEHIIRMSKGITENRMPVVKEGPLCGYEAMIIKINAHKRIAELSIKLNDRTILTGLEIIKSDR